MLTSASPWWAMFEEMIPRSEHARPSAEISDLTPEERDALLGAATWYANYHARIIAELADDRSSRAVVQRDRYYALVHALRKLGVRLPPPEILAEPEDRAA